MKNLDFIHCKNVDEALKVLGMARGRNLQASYHPYGGDHPRRQIPVSHVVWVMGKPKQVRKFCKEFMPPVLQV